MLLVSHINRLFNRVCIKSDFTGPEEIWNKKSLYFINDHGSPDTGDKKYLIKTKSQTSLTNIYTQDSDRNWGSPYTDLHIWFDGKVQDTSLTSGVSIALGHQITVSGVVQNAKYYGGSSTSKWTIRIPKAVPFKNKIYYVYIPASGNTTDSTWTNEVLAHSGLFVNDVTPRIRLTLRNQGNNLVTNENVKIGVFRYLNASGREDSWMTREMSTVTTTSASGTIDVLYSGVYSYNPGNSIYVAVIRPNITPTESFIWNTKVQ